MSEPVSERARRKDEDADAKGTPVRLSDGQDWYIRALPLSERGGKIAGGLDTLDLRNARLAAAQRRVEVAQEALDGAESDDDIETATTRLEGALGARHKAQRAVGAVQAHVAYHALSVLYNVTSEEASDLVREREWPDVLAALSGEDPAELQDRKAVELLQRALQGKEAESEDAPFPPTSSGDGDVAH